MTTSSIDISFNVSSVSIRETVDTFLNIQKKRESVLYLSSSLPENVNLSFVQQEDLTTDSNLSVVDRASSLESNKIFIQKNETIVEGVVGFSIETDQFLISNVFTEDLSTQKRIPLYYKHILDVQLSTGEIYLDIKILDSTFKEVDINTYKIVDGIVYSNLKNEFDPLTGLSTVYFVSYGIKSVGRSQKYLEILNNQILFVEADIDDIDLDTGALYTSGTTFVITEDITGIYNITVSQPGDYGIIRQSDTRIEIEAPLGVTSSDPWFVSVRNGKFINDSYRYYIAEFLTQNYYPFQPYKQIEEKSYRVGPRIVKTTKSNIVYSESDLLYPEVIVYKEDGTPRSAFHSDPTKLGTTARDTGLTYSLVQLGNPDLGGLGINQTSVPITGSSFDFAGGFIVLPAGFEIAETDSVYSYYTYEEKFYEFTSVDLNPVLNSSFIKQHLILLLRPEPLGETYDKTLYYLLVNEDGLVIESDIDFTLTGLPDSVETMISAQTLFADRDPNEVFWSISGIDLIDSCSLEGSNDQDHLLVLADIQVGNISSQQLIVPLDIRVRGGGVSESLNDESNWYWDDGSWDGKPYPANASVFIEIPYSVMNEFTADNVFEIANRHIGNGIYPVIHTYNEYNPTVTGIDIYQDILTFKWTEGPADARYAVFRTVTSQEDLELIESNISVQEYTLSGYNADTIVILGYPEGESTSSFSTSIFSYKAIGV